MSMGTARPSFPRQQTANLCAACGDRLVPGQRPHTRVHEKTGSVRCPPVVRVCTICSKDGLIPCYDANCGVIAHPGSCLIQCSCCTAWGCLAHVSNVDWLCLRCAEHGAQPFVHDGEPA